MKSLILIIKGFFIGIAKIIPGVSGALLAITFNLYEEGLNAITNFFDNPKENLYFLLKVGFGIILGITILILLLALCAKYFGVVLIASTTFTSVFTLTSFSLSHFGQTAVLEYHL